MTSWSAERWEQEGRAALLDLMAEKVAVPWAEAICRISNGAWASFRSVQPLQLRVALDQLLADGVVVREETGHAQPVVTYRLAEHGLTEDALVRERGRRRSLYRRFMKWTGDPAACGHHAEKVVFSSLVATAGEGRYLVPPQRVGHVPRVSRYEVLQGPLDGCAVLHDVKAWDQPVAMLLEVKNVHEWIYPWDRRLWELLVKAAGLAANLPVYPVLVCPHSDFTTYRMSEDIGFSRARYQVQLFSTDEKRIPAYEFDEVVQEFGLTAVRHEAEQPQNDLVAFFGTEPRRDIRSVQGNGGRRAWYELAAERFSHLALTILRFDGLAGDVSQPARGRMLRAFSAAAKAEAYWPWGGGW